MGRAAERLLTTYVWLVYAFMYAPILLMGLFSLNSGELMAFPLQGLTLRWYGETLTDARILGGLGTTFAIALPVTLITAALGSAAALALTRYDLPLKPLFLVQLCLPFFLPRIVFAIAEVMFLGAVGLPRSLLTVWIAQSLVILPFTTVIVASVLARIDPRLEEAAADLGASGWQTFRRVTLPLMRNGVLAAAFVAFVLSSAEYTVSAFTSGRVQPLSVLVASDFRFHLSPKLNALAMLIVAFNVLVIVASEVVRRRVAGGSTRAAATAGRGPVVLGQGTVQRA
jgi:spermidine/putrescine transport system permease protein